MRQKFCIPERLILLAYAVSKTKINNCQKFPFFCFWPFDFFLSSLNFGLQQKQLAQTFFCAYNTFVQFVLQFWFCFAQHFSFGLTFFWSNKKNLIFFLNLFWYNFSFDQKISFAFYLANIFCDPPKNLVFEGQNKTKFHQHPTFFIQLGS